MSYILGLDVGTSRCKAALVSADGPAFAAASGPYHAEASVMDGSEQDPSDWWAAAVVATKRVVRAAGAKPQDIVGVGLSGQMHSLVLLDAETRVLRPAILWSDKRSATQCREASRRVPDLPEITGNALIPAFTLPQLLWIRENEPQVYGRIEHVVVPKDWLRLEMTHVLATEPSDASGTGMFDINRWVWSGRITDTLGIPERWLPECVPSASVAGLLTARAARTLGLAEGTPIAAGAADQAAQAAAMGAVKPGVLGVTIGTSGVVVVTCLSPARGVFCHAIDGRWLALNSMHAAGLSLDWYRATFHPGRSIGELLASAEQVDAGAGGLLFLPFMLGEREAMEPTIPSAFVGFGTGHRSGHFVRAILEGVAFEIRRMVEQWIGDGLRIRHVRFSGGGAQSVLWRQTLADTLGLPVSKGEGGAAEGAALLGGVALGWWSSVDEAAAQFRGVSASVDPDPGSGSRLDAAFGEYLNLLGRLNASKPANSAPGRHVRARQVSDGGLRHGAPSGEATVWEG
ncbi:MAG: xylulokinase [Candidatus Limnocylindrales bacterium]|jgi:xylulokinase